MSFHPENGAELRACARRLITLIELLVQTRPTVVFAIERSAQRIVTDDVRQQIAERVQRFSADDVRIVEALTEHLDQRRPGGGHPRDPELHYDEYMPPPDDEN